MVDVSTITMKIIMEMLCYNDRKKAEGSNLAPRVWNWKSIESSKVSTIFKLSWKKIANLSKDENDITTLNELENPSKILSHCHATTIYGWSWCGIQIHSSPISTIHHSNDDKDDDDDDDNDDMTALCVQCNIYLK